jgi:amino acid transporter
MLRRTIGLPLLTLYGLGTILGAGIYVLIGEVAAAAGTAAPTAFVLAAVLAGVTAFSFAELSARIPRSAGEAAYVEAAFGSTRLAMFAGWAVIVVGTVSAATMVRGFVGYLEVFVRLPEAPVVVATVIVLCGIAVWGIGESLIAAAVVTVLEVGGLVFVCIIARDALSELPSRWPTLLPSPDLGSLLGVLSGAFVAFYAFIGFEDMVNIAEEVKQPERTLPRAIVLALLISTALYFAVATVAILAVPDADLAGSTAPLAVVVESRGLPPEIIAGISLLAVLNGALVQIIMASRVLYGLASQTLVWPPFAYLHPRTQTPAVGTAAVALALLALALYFSLGGLARATSFIALGIFALVNASLWRIKQRDTVRPAFAVPRAVPILGLVLCIGTVVWEALRLIR